MRAMSRHRVLGQRDGGFTLVEVIVAMFVLAIVMLSIVFVQAKALTTNAESQARQQATAAANQAMEQLRAMPWNYLRKGLYSGFVTAAGGDSYVSGSTLTVTGTPYTLKMGTTATDLAKPWPPLFDASGSNKQTLTSGSGNGTSIELRSYTTTVSGAGATDAVGLIVVATWTKPSDGSTQRTVLTSTAYAPTGSTCGSTETAPFLAACQASFEATASASRVDVSVTASTDDGLGESPVLPGSSYYSMHMSTAGAAARVSSQQVSNASAFAPFGGVEWDDSDPTTEPAAQGWSKGFTQYSLRASNDTTTGAAPANPVGVSGAGASSVGSIAGGVFSLAARSDESRLASLAATTTQSCSTGLASAIAAGAPCAHAGLSANASGTGQMTLSVSGEELLLAGVKASPTTSVNHAWAGRFLTVAGNASVGCQTLSGSGCASAGAQQTFGSVVIGDVQTGTEWDANAANGLVVISGYSDAVSVQRGVGFASTAPAFSRSASVTYWNGTGYSSPVAITASSAFTADVPAVTWTTGAAVITATARLQVTGSSASVKSSTACKGVEGCSVTATNGYVSVVTEYHVAPAGGSTFAPWRIAVATTINGSQAAALFKEAPNA
ncbi:hypothetical protein Lsed01_00272 [Demequina sediminis]|uniref:Prepilin-type N-terminal cleavage/methylation domain-containing protein n=2 Tax=Demequina sediminis TaxID=1930058 RepID=A0ABP9WFI0_9MICO